MKRLYIYYILPLLSMLMLSCVDDLNINGNQGNVASEGSMLLNISLDIPETRTRAIDMTPGTAVYLDKIWIGIYDKDTGIRVGGTDLTKEFTLSHRLTGAGEELKNMVEVMFYDEDKLPKDFKRIGPENISSASD